LPYADTTNLGNLAWVLTASSKLWRPVRRLRVHRTLSSATAATLDKTPAARSRTLAAALDPLALTAPFAELYARLNQPDIFIVALWRTTSLSGTGVGEGRCGDAPERFARGRWEFLRARKSGGGDAFSKLDFSTK